MGPAAYRVSGRVSFARWRDRDPGHAEHTAPGAVHQDVLQFSTRPLNGAQSLDGVFSAAFHAIERHDAVLAVQVVVHRPDTTVRGVALPLTADTFEFALGDPPKSRAAQNWPLAPVACQDGDVIAINVGIAANNQSNTLAQSIGFSVYASAVADLSRLDDPQIANSWLEFSAPLTFY